MFRQSGVMTIRKKVRTVCNCVFASFVFLNHYPGTPKKAATFTVHIGSSHLAVHIMLRHESTIINNMKGNRKTVEMSVMSP